MNNHYAKVCHCLGERQNVASVSLPCRCSVVDLWRSQFGRPNPRPNCLLLCSLTSNSVLTVYSFSSASRITANTSTPGNLSVVIALRYGALKLLSILRTVEFAVSK